MAFVGKLLRVVIGFAFACLAAGFVQVLFAVTPAELIDAVDDRLGVAVTWGLLSATQIAVFAAPFALISAIISEWQSVRSFAYHAMVAMAIAVAGFGLIYATELPTEATIVNSYAMAAYLTSGFVGGFVYWLAAGRWAGRGEEYVRMESARRRPARPQPEHRAEPAAKPGNADPMPPPQNKPVGTTGTVPATKPAAGGGAVGQGDTGSGAEAAAKTGAAAQPKGGGAEPPKSEAAAQSKSSDGEAKADSGTN